MTSSQLETIQFLIKNGIELKLLPKIYITENVDYSFYTVGDNPKIASAMSTGKELNNRLFFKQYVKDKISIMVLSQEKVEILVKTMKIYALLDDNVEGLTISTIKLISALVDILNE